MLLIGFFNTLDKIKYGMDNKKRPYYGFTPLYHKNEYRPKKIKITYSGKQKGKLLALIKIENIISTQFFPIGTIVNIVGKINNDNILKLLKLGSEHKYVANKITIKNLELPIYNNNFITIDPNNSIDIDDGFYLDFPYLDIIIACPSLFLSDDDIMSKFYQAVSSRYSDRVDHLWGNDITYKSSLLQNNSTILMVLKYNLETNKFKIGFYRGVNKNQLTYEQFDNLIKTKYYEWGQRLKKYFSFNNSKELVQEIMILANKTFTKFLENENAPILYRKFVLKHNYDDLELSNDIKQIFNQRKSESAIYTLDKSYHSHIGDNYSHFTSPLRRWVDCYHQMLIFNILNKTEININKINDKFISKINDKFISIKKFHREYNYLMDNKILLNTIRFNKIYNGYVYNLRNNYLEIWCPELKRFIKVEFIHSKLLFQKEIIEISKSWEIKDKISNKILNINIGQKINFSLQKTCNILPSKVIYGFLKNLN